jgi:hypothetical protein
MNRVVELVSSFPTVVFTGLLAFCLVYWLLSLVISGLDGSGEVDADSDFDADFDGDVGNGSGHGGSVSHAGHVGVGGHAGHMGHASHGGHDVHGAHTSDHVSHAVGNHGAHGGRSFSAKFAKTLRLGEVPLALGLTVLSFGAWATSGIMQLVFDGVTKKHPLIHLVSLAISIAIMFVALALGFRLLGAFAKVSAPLFVTTTAPMRHEALGGTCRIRTTHVTGSLGEAEVLTGVAKGQIVRVRTDKGDFVRGDIAQLVDYDETTSAFTIVELDPVLHEPNM